LTSKIGGSNPRSTSPSRQHGHRRHHREPAVDRDPDSHSAKNAPLPAWAQTVRLRHLVHHTSALPDDSQIDAVITTEPDRTTAAVLHALAQFPVLDRRPGDEYVYSNAGYVCHALAVERAIGQTLPQFAQHHLFTPSA
jgi:CubicO group peptidase (beta-lactamase class C family)